LQATKLYIDEVNRKGGVNGHLIELMLVDDASSAEVGRANVEKIADSPSIAVLGHFLSTVSLAAGQGYWSFEFCWAWLRQRSLFDRGVYGSWRAADGGFEPLVMR
jgi:hypothetical protein